MTSKEELATVANRDPTTSPYFVTVLYGDLGSRKTTTACSMVNKKGLLLSADDSWKVLKNPRHSELDSKMIIREFDYVSRLEYIDLKDYDTIIWDTVSHSVDVYLDLLYDEADWGGKFREKLVTKNPELKGLETLAPVDYRVTRDHFRPILNRLFRETNAHIIFTSQLTEPIPNLSANQQKRPAIPQATFKIIGTRADVIAYTSGNGNNFTADVTQGITQLGKSRIEGIQGKMSQDAFVSKYKEYVFK